MIILSILITFSLDYVLLFLGEKLMGGVPCKHVNCNCKCTCKFPFFSDLATFATYTAIGNKNGSSHRGSLYNTAMTMGHSFWNEFWSRTKFLLYSHDKNEWLCLRHSHLCGFHPGSDRHVPHALDYKICDFQSGANFQFTWYQNEYFIWIENRNELI